MGGIQYDSYQTIFEFVKFSSLFLSLMFIFVRGESTSIVQTDKGPVQGEILTTVMKSIRYSSFKGIPYAKPPIGDLRFKPPEEAVSWGKRIVLATTGDKCPHIAANGFTGTEDCLKLHVYTPKTNFSESFEKLLPVMVWIHGGRFKRGFAASYGPDFLIEENVVMVAMNYRLGALGNLALGIEGATGNAALKDQTLALKWVQKNIAKFGGDPNSVTLFGQSSGASHVDLHFISDASRGLFHRSISMSGTPLNPWAFSSAEQAEARATRLAQLVGIKTAGNPKTEILKELMKKSARELVMETEKITKADREFKPTIENIRIAGTSAFLTKCPAAKLKSGNFNHLPHMAGFVANEALFFATSVKNLMYQTDFAMNSMSIRMPDKIRKKFEPFLDRLTKNSDGQLSDFENTFIMDVVNLISDALTATGTDIKQKLMTSNSSIPFYYYRNSFDAGSESPHVKSSKIYYNGTAHGDDLSLIFYIPSNGAPLDPQAPFSIVRQRVVRLFTNFAKYGNPTPNGTSDPLLNINWPESGKHGIHLEIGENLKVGPRPISDDARALRNAQICNGFLENLNGC